MTLFYHRMNNAVLRLEAAYGRLLASVLAAITLMAAAAVYVRPAIRTDTLGVLYGRMAEDPFVYIPGNAMAFRVLTPLISYLLGLRGQLIIVTNLIIATVLLVLVFNYFRNRAPQPADAFFAAAVMAFSLVTLTTVYCGGYSDSLTYLLVFLMWWHRTRRVIFYLLFFLALLNRECVLFLIPWFAVLRLFEAERKTLAVLDLTIGLGLGVGLYYLFRVWILSAGPGPFESSYYLKPLLEDPLYWIRRSYVNWGTGFFSVFKAFWIYPVLAGIATWKTGLRRDCLSIAVLLICVWTQMIVAYDSSRMLTLSFVVMLIALEYLMRTGSYRLREWAGLALVVNFLVPQLYTAAETVLIMPSTPGRIILMLIFDLEVW